MAATKVKYVMEGPHKGKDFAPRNHPNFQFVKGEYEAVVDAASVPAMDRILGGYGAVRADAAVESKPAAKAPAKKTPAKKTAAKKAEVKDAAKETGSTDDKVQPDGKQSEQGNAPDGGSDDDSDAGEAGNATSEQDGAGSENEEEMI